MKIHNHTTPKAIRRHSIRLWLATAITMTATTLATTLATLTGCSADNAPETTVCANEAVTFGATIDSRNAPDNGPASDSRNASDSRTAPATRAITNGTFDDGDPILVHIYGTLKDFAYSTAHGGFVHNPTSSGANIDPTPPYWQGGDTQTDALAYGPATSIVRNSQDEYTLQTRVAADQRGDDAYTGGDYVYTAQALQRQSPALTFRHGMARVVIRLRPGGSLTDEEVAGTTLMLGNDNLLTTADIHPQTGALTAHAPTATTPGGLQPQTVTPHRCATTPAGYAVAYEALLPPQDVSGKLLINVRFSGKALGYAAESGSALKGGHEYIYNVTVEETRLVVTVTPGDVPWQDGILTTTIDGKEFRLIRTAEDLARFASDVNGDGKTPGSAKTELNALQVADIDLQDLRNSKDAGLRALAANWVPIGSNVGNFGIQYGGIYCGNGYTISGLRITTHHEPGNIGLFGSIGGSSLLTGIHLRDVEITGTNIARIGALAGRVGNGTVTLCSAQGKIEVTLSSGSACVGGLVGIAVECSINRCHTNVDITAEAPLQDDDYAYAGGIVGRNNRSLYTNSTLFACRAEGSVSLTGTGTSTDPQPLCAGGIAGRNDEGWSIRACMATGNVNVTYTGTDAVNAYAGGLVGYNIGLLDCSYARGTATATVGSNAKGYAGAIIGGYDDSGSSTVGYCFGAGEGGAGTSGLETATIPIVYNEKPGQGEIVGVMAGTGQGAIISTTLYNATATPAYGISVSSRDIKMSDVWNTSDPTWPSPDMKENGH